ncbi:retinoic acid early transcript 1E [Marmota monax]|nr:retinoic acid early transcript 1E [Marmota monax]
MSGGPVSGRLLRVTAREARRVRRGRLKPEAAGVAGDVPWPGPGRECGGPRRDLHHHLIPDLQDQLHPGVTDGKYDCGRSAVSQPAGTSQKEEGHCRGGDSGFKGSCAGHSRSAPSPGPMAGALRAALFLGVLAQLPPDFLWASPVGTHSLCLDFTVKSQSRPGESWCEVQGSVDKTAFLQYDCESNKIKPLGHLGKEVNATKTWTQLTEMLRELGQDLRMILLDINLEQKMARGHLTLQAKMSCQLEGNNDLGSSWNFSIDGQPSLCLNVMHMEWTVINPRARGIKEKWENDKELREHLRKVSMGDCNHWLRELLKHWKKMPAPTSTVPVTSGSPRTSSVSVTSLVVIIVLILVVIIIIFMPIKF